MCNSVRIYCNALADAAQILTKVKMACINKLFNSWLRFVPLSNVKAHHRKYKLGFAL